jgi:hypothetical protein
LAQYEFKWVTLPLLYTKQDAYRHPVPLLQELSANSGWKPKLAVLFGRIRDWFQERSARTVMRSNIPGYDKSALPDEIAEIYKQVIKAQADMQPDPIRDVSAAASGGCGRQMLAGFCLVASGSQTQVNAACESGHVQTAAAAATMSGCWTPKVPPVAAESMLSCSCCGVSPQLVSKEIFLQLRSQAEQRRRQGWDKVHWEMLDADQLSSSMLRVRSRCAG